MPKVVEISSSQHTLGAFARPTLNSWIVIVQIFILLIVVFRIECHLRRVEHRSPSLARHVKGCMPGNDDKDGEC